MVIAASVCYSMGLLCLRFGVRDQVRRCFRRFEILSAIVCFVPLCISQLHPIDKRLLCIRHKTKSITKYPFPFLINDSGHFQEELERKTEPLNSWKSGPRTYSLKIIVCQYSQNFKKYIRFEDCLQ